MFRRTPPSRAAWSEKQHAGRSGEEAAARWLEAHGFEVVDRNWRAGRYEIDLVALRGDELHFVEVKTRRSDSLTTPEQAIDHRKRQAMIQAARRYLAHYPAVGEVVFDLVAVERAADGTVDIRYIPDAVEMHW